MDIEHYRRRLEKLEQELLNRLTRESGTAREIREDQANPSDQAIVDEIKATYFGLAHTDWEILAELRRALDRIDEGTFGRCIVDEGPIDEKRLESVPWTPYCLKHQQELEEATRLRTPTL